MADTAHPLTTANTVQENAAIEDLGDDLGKKETVDLAAGLLASGHIQITHDELLALDGKLDQMPIDKAKTVRILTLRNSS